MNRPKAPSPSSAEPARLPLTNQAKKLPREIDLSLGGMAFMAVTSFLLVWVLLAGAPHHWIKCETVACCLGEQLIGGCRCFNAWQRLDVPQRFAFLGHQDGIAHFQDKPRVEECHAQGEIVRIGNRISEWQGIKSSVAGFAAHVLYLFLIAID